MTCGSSKTSAMELIGRRARPLSLQRGEKIGAAPCAGEFAQQRHQRGAVRDPALFSA